MNKYAIYLRVSTRTQGASGLGLDAQRNTCTNYIASKKGTLLKEFTDIESGTNRHRKGLFDAINFCKANGCTLVIAKLDRLARDVEFTFRVINTGIDIYFCDMPSINTMILGVFASVAQYEREIIAKRTKDALQAKKERGEVWNKDRKFTPNAHKNSVEARKQKALNNPHNIAFLEFLELWEAKFGKITANTNFLELADELNKRGKKTSTGLEFNAKRARSMYINNLNNINN